MESEGLLAHHGRIIAASTSKVPQIMAVVDHVFWGRRPSGCILWPRYWSLCSLHCIPQGLTQFMQGLILHNRPHLPPVSVHGTLGLHVFYLLFFLAGR